MQCRPQIELPAMLEIEGQRDQGQGSPFLSEGHEAAFDIRVVGRRDSPGGQPAPRVKAAASSSIVGCASSVLPG